jgi:pimeloyl-ACP methyl ester carboxylesterase
MAKATGYKPLWKGVQNQKFDSAISAEVEVAIVFGDADRTLPEEIAQEKSVAPSHSDWITVENCAHVIMWNYPDLTVDLIKQTAEKAEIK